VDREISAGFEDSETSGRKRSWTYQGSKKSAIVNYRNIDKKYKVYL